MILLICLISLAIWADSLTIKPILVIGSLNQDIIIPVARLPNKHETLLLAPDAMVGYALGGKGANQAIAAARLSRHSNGSISARFVTNKGRDHYSIELFSSLQAEGGLDVSSCLESKLNEAQQSQAGQGYVFLESDGSATSIVVGGANVGWDLSNATLLEDHFEALAADSSILMLQREIPEIINLLAARSAKLHEVLVVLDLGGVDAPLSLELMEHVDILSPNENELQRITGLPTGSRGEAVEAARALQQFGKTNKPAVMVTLGAKGSFFLPSPTPRIPYPLPIWQEALPIPGGKVVDATGAGDSFRAAFSVCLVENDGQQSVREHPTEQSEENDELAKKCLQFAAAAGSFAVSKKGAMPSLPRRQEVEDLLAGKAFPPSTLPNSSSSFPPSCQTIPEPEKDPRDEDCPLKFASRLNSMKSRLDLFERREQASSSNILLEMIRRQGRVQGLNSLHLNYPEHHLLQQNTEFLKASVRGAGMAVGAVNVRFPKEEFLNGAFSNPNEDIRRQAVDLTLRSCEWAQDLGASQLVVWPQFDGYDYLLATDYVESWQMIVKSYRELCDLCSLRVSIEPKPTDEYSRFSLVPSTASALLLASQVNRPNFGVTLDYGHLLMASENPAQSIAMALSANKLFGVHLNDGYSKLGAEDGLAFGSVSSNIALEAIFWLRRLKYKGEIYFDTFPIREDPVREAEHNIQVFKRLWRTCARLETMDFSDILARGDAMASLKFLENKYIS